MKFLKYLAVLAVLAFTVSAIAAGTGENTTSYLLDAVNGAPSGATAGIAMGGANASGNQVPIRSVIVTVTSHIDGGSDTAYVVGGELLFWRSQPVSPMMADGGVQWSRFTKLDAFLSIDAGTGANTNANSQTTILDLSSGGWGIYGDSTNQLYVSTLGVATDGGNTLGAGAPIPHTVTLEGRY